ncbi:unnamed protein product [Vitrella brassicaformis CCMP3155]|uniref:Uncharacterized protein n=1 Tax=Vitrella brassicaformis (strain CCMP3155) TaxID=1169540 RepID=A0A0G4F305_VITBC|nr:unnamed protein product [Vitrella brassicaformis CCMP3155]|eukprot:CEM06424.1 unnamed protein product [Vitrella brassicaformis CCMP3155]
MRMAQKISLDKGEVPDVRCTMEEDSTIGSLAMVHRPLIHRPPSLLQKIPTDSTDIPLQTLPSSASPLPTSEEDLEALIEKWKLSQDHAHKKDERSRGRHAHPSSAEMEGEGQRGAEGSSGEKAHRGCPFGGWGYASADGCRLIGQRLHRAQADFFGGVVDVWERAQRMREGSSGDSEGKEG